MQTLALDEVSSRRSQLTAGVFGVGIIGLILATVPFLQSMMPNDALIAGNVLHIDVSDIEPGDYKQVTWNAKPIVVLRTDDRTIDQLRRYNEQVWGPPISKTSAPTFYVYEALSTFLGCSLGDTAKAPNDLDLPIGWWDICHMGYWDRAGRAFKERGVSPGTKLRNLTSVRFRILNENTIALHH